MDWIIITRHLFKLKIFIKLRVPALLATGNNVLLWRTARIRIPNQAKPYFHYKLHTHRKSSAWKTTFPRAQPMDCHCLRFCRLKNPLKPHLGWHANRVEKLKGNYCNSGYILNVVEKDMVKPLVRPKGFLCALPISDSTLQNTGIHVHTEGTVAWLGHSLPHPSSAGGIIVP